MNNLSTRILVALVAAGISVAAFAQSAPAQRTFSSYFFFGDSLTDNGNTFFYTGQPPAPYVGGRFSNGPTFAEYLRSGLTAVTAAPSSQKTNINFAFAGATATGSTPVPASLGVQLSLYQSRGITASPNDLFVVLAGANDILNGVQVAANQNATAMSGIGVGASTAVASSVQSLASFGAKNILVLNLPDISKTPRFTTGSGVAAASLVQNASYAFNNDIKGRIAGLSLAADVNVTVFDLSAVLQTILSNPQRFGFSVTNQEYVGILLAGGNPGDVNNYVFWDGIHPTTKTHQIFANVLTEVLNPEFVLGTAAVQSTVALLASDLSADAIAARLDGARVSLGRHETADGYITVSSKNGAFDVAGYRYAFDYSGSDVTAGFDLNLSKNLLVGAAVSAENIRTTLSAGAGSFKFRGQLVSAYAQWKAGRFFADAVGSYGSHDLKDVRRTTALGAMETSGKVDGDRLGGSVRVGFDVATEKLHFTPFAGLRYAKATLDTYTETGVASLNYTFNEQTAKSFDGLVGATADWSIGTKSLPMVLGVTAVYQKDLNDDTHQLSGKLADTVSARAVINANDGLGETVKLGVHLGGLLGKRWGWQAGYTGDLRKEGDAARQFSVTLSTGF